jgi:hypothetical protein
VLPRAGRITPSLSMCYRSEWVVWILDFVPRRQGRAVPALLATSRRAACEAAMREETASAGNAPRATYGCVRGIPLGKRVRRTLGWWRERCAAAGGRKGSLSLSLSVSVCLSLSLPLSLYLSLLSLSLSLSLSLANENLYINPPWALLNRVVVHIVDHQATATVVVPYWPRQAWFQRLKALSKHPPVFLPVNPSLFRPTSTGHRPIVKNPSWKVIAFRVSGSLVSPRIGQQIGNSSRSWTCSQHYSQT